MNNDFTMALLLQSLWRHRTFMIVWSATLLVLAVIIIFSLEPRYHGSALIALDTRQLRFTEVSAVVSTPSQQIDSSLVRSEVEILQSDALARQDVKDLKLDQDPDFAPHPSILTQLKSTLFKLDLKPPTDRERVEAAVMALRRHLSVVNDGRSYVITVGYDAASPDLAARLANHHAEVYIERQRLVKDRALEKATSWINREVDDLAVRLQQAERAVQAYREEHSLYLVKGTPIYEQQLTEVTKELAQARIELGTRQARTDQAGGGKGNLAEVEIARLRVADLNRAVLTLEQQVAATERAQGELRALERQTEAMRALYASLLLRQKQIATQIGIQQPDAQVVSPATEPVRPSFPNKLLYMAIATIISVSSGGGIVLMQDRRRTYVENIEEAEPTIGVHILAALPKLRGRRASMPNEVAGQPRSGAAEAIRTLRNALAIQPGGTPRILAVTSALPGEGKTSLALALSRSLSASGLQVLLIDCDLRRGQLAQIALGYPVKQGIGSVMRGKIGFWHAIRKDRMSSTHILASEAAITPQDLLDPTYLQPFLAATREKYDYVIVDTPPIGAVSDALLVARSVEGMLLILRANSTPAALVATAIKRLGACGTPIAGAVLNFADPRRVGPAGYPVLGYARSYARS